MTIEHKKIFAAIIALQMATLSYGQTVPSDLLDLSLEELFTVNIDQGADGNTLGHSKWNFSYNFQKSKFKDYYDGNSKIPVQDVLWIPGEEPRSDSNYPVVPTEIDQQVHALRLGYNFNQALSINIVAPYIKQSTDHISIVPGYDQFVIETEGIGDITIMGAYQFQWLGSGNWQAGTGISLPSGSIDEEGDTPRAPGEQQLPYTMQLGSGTYDIPAFLSYANNGSSYDWGGDIRGKLRLGENDRNYTLGNNLSVSGWARLTTIEWIQPTAQLSYWYGGKISGMDSDLEVPGPYPYPAPVVDPNRFGGEQLDLKLGIRIPLMKKTQHIELSYSIPLYRDLNGPQSGEEYTVGLSFSTAW